MTRVNEDTTFIPKHLSIKFDSENPVKFVQECVEQDGLELTQFILNSFTNKSDLDISLVETLKGLLIRFPSCQQLNWCLPTFKVLFKANTGITSNNNRIILYRKSIIELFDSQIQNLSNSASMKDIDVYINLLQSTNDKNLMLSAWGLVLVMFGQSLHRTSHLNELLSLTEATFNSTRLTLRVGSFKAWKRLILNFTFGEHLYNQKRINLILIPIWNCIEFEKSNAVRETCLECFLYLVVQLTKHSPSYDFIQLVIAPLINFNLDLNLLTVFLNLIVKMIQDIGDENNQFGGIIDDYKLFGASTDILLQHIQPIVTVKDWSVSHFELFLRFLRNVLNSSLVLKNLPLDRLWYFIIRYMEWAWNTGSQSFDIITKVVLFIHQNITNPVTLNILLPGLCQLHLPDRELTKTDLTGAKYLVDHCDKYMQFTAPGTKLYVSLTSFQSKLKSKFPTSPYQPEERKRELEKYNGLDKREVQSSPVPQKNNYESKNRLKRTATEYVIIPPKPSNHQPLTDHQIETIENHPIQTKLFNTVDLSQKVDVDSPQMTKRWKASGPSNENNQSSNLVQHHINGLLENLQGLDQCNLKELVSLQKQLIMVMTNVCEKIDIQS